MFSSSDSAGAVLRLRNATRGCHQRLHAHPLFTGILSRSPDLPGYVVLLRAFYGFYAALEPILVSSSKRVHRPDLYGNAIRAEWLSSDLHRLGYSTSTIERLPLVEVCRRFETPGSLAGVLYVVEGSALGGRVIARLLPASLAAGARFFSGYGETTQDRWIRTCRYIGSQCRSANVLDSATQAARWTFQYLGDWLDRHV